MKILFFEVNPREEKHLSSLGKSVDFSQKALSFENAHLYSDAEVVCGMVHSDFSASVLDQIPGLKMIALRSVGYNNVDLAYCREHDIVVTHVPDYGSHAIAEHVFALLLSTLRNIELANQNVQNDIFDEEGLQGETLAGKTIGIIGTGKIGLHVCRIASLGFQMKVVAFDKYPNQDLAKKYNFEYVDLENLYSRADVISLHVPLFPETEHLINKNSLMKMKDGVVLVNTSRGKLICTEDLVVAIKSQKVRYALLDVLEHEGNLIESRGLISLPNTVVTPHIAYYTHETVENMYAGAIDSINRFISNRDLGNKVILGK